MECNSLHLWWWCDLTVGQTVSQTFSENWSNLSVSFCITWHQVSPDFGALALKSCCPMLSCSWFPPNRHTMRMHPHPCAQVKPHCCYNPSRLFLAASLYQSVWRPPSSRGLKSLQSLQQWWWCWGQEAVKDENETRQAAVSSYHHAWECRWTGCLGLHLLCNTGAWWESGYFKVGVSWGPPAWKRTDRCVAFRELAMIWVGR